jgi:hypothetical protein
VMLPAKTGIEQANRHSTGISLWIRMSSSACNS